MVFSSSETRQWFIDSGRQAVSAVIESAGKVHEILKRFFLGVLSTAVFNKVINYTLLYFLIGDLTLLYSHL